ncbi:MAG: hypothetical protein AABZ08_05375 [Planctomycetota bacterium]
MSADEFMKQQYLTLRDEIRASKARIFILLILGTLFVPAAGFAAREFSSTYASGSMPFLILVLMLAFVMEQNSIIRAGKYLKDHVEPHIEGVVTWEAWLERNQKTRDTDRYFFGSFLLVFVLFYTIAATLAVETMAAQWPGQGWYAVVAYGMGGLWFVVVLMSHWHSCTRTT